MTHKEVMISYREKHRGEIKDRQSAYTETHKEEKRYYRMMHTELYRYLSALRRSRKRNAPGADYITIDLLEQRWKYYGQKCYLCGYPMAATDHVKPLVKGGSQWPSNLRPICKTCNSLKGAKWPYDFDAHKTRVKAQIAKWCEVLDLVAA
jgi:5-methylcytosine-specific restriction endonuclease McrA